MGGREKCALALFAAYAKMSGQAFDSAMEQKLLSKFGNDGHAAAVYARATQRYIEAAADEAIRIGTVNPTITKVLGKVEEFGIPARNLFSFVMKPSVIMGPDLPEQINKLYLDHLRTHGKYAEHAWKKEVVPKLKEWEKAVLEGINPIYKDYVVKYFEKHKAGGQLYGQKQHINPFAQLGRNAVGNFVSNNPAIAAWNVFEFMPKALAYSIDKQGLAGVGSLLKGLGDYASATNGNLWQRLPELDMDGVYGLHEVGKTIPKTGISNLLDTTELLLRNASYFVGEAIQPGFGQEALEKIAFVPKFGNEPMAFLDAAGTDTLTLMRYSFASNEMYLSMWNKARKGNLNAIGALTAFSAMTALQTGTGSAIPMPTPIYDALPDDWKQALADFDSRANLNVTQHLLGTDVSDSVRPLSAPALGVGLAMASTDIKNTLSGVGKSVEAVSEGDVKTAAAEATKAFFTGAQVANIPGVNMLSKRFVDSLADVVTEEIDLEEIPEDILTRTKLYQEPEFEGSP